MAGLLVALVALIILAGSVYQIVRLRRPGVESVRSNAPGALVDLPSGCTHARWHGAEGGPVLVCIHGLSSGAYVWDGLMPYLEDLGYSILTYDLYGRGFSDRPLARQNAAFFLRQLDELLEAEGVEGKVTLLGYSMGGAIAAAKAAADPGRVERLMLIAPAGLGLELGRFADIATRIPVIGDWMQEVLGGHVMRWLYGRNRLQEGLAQSVVDQMLDAADLHGSLAAMLSSQRGILAHDFEPEHEEIAARGIPVLAIWGDGDAIIPKQAMGRLTLANRNAVQVEVAGADHNLTFTHPASVAEAIEDNS